MKRTERLAEARAPDGSVLTLLRHDGAYVIRVAGVDLMSTRRYHSEERLAEVACAPFAGLAAPRVLIGGLGFGFTLRRALQLLPEGADVVVAEVVAEIIDWNRDPRYRLPGEALADPRVEVRNEDVLAMLREGVGGFDAIMLDVDNGAEALTTGGNADLYRAAGIRRTIAALRPGGRIVYWSAGRDPAFEAALRRAGLAVEAVGVRAHPTAGGMHALIVADAAAPSSMAR